MERLPTTPNQTPQRLFNPSIDLFTFTFDKEKYTIAGFAVETYPKWLADKMAPYLADFIISKRGVIKNYHLDKEELLKEIYIQ